MVGLNLSESECSPADISSLTLREGDHLDLLLNVEQEPILSNKFDSHSHAFRSHTASPIAAAENTDSAIAATENTASTIAATENIDQQDTLFDGLDDKPNTCLDGFPNHAFCELPCMRMADSSPSVLHGKTADFSPIEHLDDAMFNGLIDGDTGAQAISVDQSGMENEFGLSSEGHCTLSDPSQIGGGTDSEGPNTCTEPVNMEDDQQKIVKRKPSNVNMLLEDSNSDDELDSDSDVGESDGGSSESESVSSSSEEEDEDMVSGNDDGDDSNDNNNHVKGKEKHCCENDKSPQIQNFDNEDEAFGTDDEENGGPIKSKNELDTLAPVLNVDVVLESHHQMLPVGVVSSIIGSIVIIDGSVKHNPLMEGSLLWITETRSLLGLVDEIFGPVKNPYYVVRFNSDGEVPTGIHEGVAVSFVVEFSGHIINENSLYIKGYDASGKNDEELSDEAEFSDDEKEAEYRRSQMQAKRGMGSNRHAKQDKVNVKKVQSKNTKFQKNIHHKVRHSAEGVLQPAPCTSSPLETPSVIGNPASCTSSQLGTLSVTGHPAPCTSNQLETSSIIGNPSSVGSLCSTSSAISFINAPSMVPLVPNAVQSGCFIGGQRQNLLMQQPNTPWGLQIPPPQQQNINSIMNAPFQQLNDNNSYQLHPYQQPPHQQLCFPNGIIFQQPFASNQGCLSNFGLNVRSPSQDTVRLRPPGQGCFNQAPMGFNINEISVSAINNSAQGNMHLPMQFNMGVSTGSAGRPPYTSSRSRPPCNSRGRCFGKRV